MHKERGNLAEAAKRTGRVIVQLFIKYIWGKLTPQFCESHGAFILLKGSTGSNVLVLQNNKVMKPVALFMI
jgi:hypothetical protein